MNLLREILPMNSNNMMRRFPVPLPERMERLPIDKRGYPVPKFVEWIDGEPDFRVMSANHMQRCIAFRQCWMCGEPLGRHKAFVVGPMCCINRLSAEPPSHYECATFSVQACPFLSIPTAKRREANMPENQKEPAGIMLKHNPGASAIWVTHGYKVEFYQGGVLFRMEEPSNLEFWAKGRRADRREVDRAVEAGIPRLLDAAVSQGREALHELERQRNKFTKLLDHFLPVTED